MICQCDNNKCVCNQLRIEMTTYQSVSSIRKEVIDMGTIYHRRGTFMPSHVVELSSGI